MVKQLFLWEDEADDCHPLTFDGKTGVKWPVWSNIVWKLIVIHVEKETHQNPDAMRTESSHDDCHECPEEKSSIAEGIWHCQDSRS